MAEDRTKARFLASFGISVAGVFFTFGFANLIRRAYESPEYQDYMHGAPYDTSAVYLPWIGVALSVAVVLTSEAYSHSLAKKQRRLNTTGR